MRSWLRLVCGVSSLVAGGAASAAVLPGDILVTDQAQAMLIDVNPTTGARSDRLGWWLFSGEPSGIALASIWWLLLSVTVPHTRSFMLIWLRAQLLITSGGYLADPANIAFDSSGNIIVADTDAFGGSGGVIRVNPTTGNQVPVSSGR